MQLFSREGVIIECPQNDLFHNACDMIIASGMAVRELDYDDNDDEWLLGYILKELETLVVVKIMTSNELL